MNKILAKNIIATITYYDVLDYPLTSFEIWKHLIRSSADHSVDVWTLKEIIECLQTDNIERYAGEKNGMYFLHGREHLVSVRRTRENISLRKVHRLRRIVSLLRIAPFVRMMCVTGRLSYHNCETTSDLDLLIVYEGGHIWTGRFFLTILTHILGVRRYGDKTNDRACLNYHITTQVLTVPTKDLFAAHEYSFIYPLFDAQDFFAEFVKCNQWITSYKPHYATQDKRHRATLFDTVITRYMRSVGEWILADRAMERRLEKIQKKKIQENPKTRTDGALILYSDQHLVFLPKPHGPVVFEKYKERYDALEIDF